MADDVPTAEETKALLAVSRKRALAFGLCLGKKPDASVMILHRNKSPEILMRMAKKAGETPKVTCGKIETKGKKIKLDCAADAPPGLAKNLRRYLQTLGLKGMSVTVLDSTGTVLEEELDEEEQAAAEAQAQQEEAPAEEQAAAAETASEDEAPATEATEEQQESDPAAGTSAGEQEPVADASAQDEQKAEAMDLARKAKELKQAVEAIGGNSADKLLKAIGLAAQQIRAAENRKAEHMLGKIEEALKKLTDSQARKSTAENGSGDGTPEISPEDRTNRMSSMAALEQSVDTLLAEFA